MIPKFFFGFIILFVLSGNLFSQERTVETRTSVDSLKHGDTTITKSVIVSTTEDITPYHSIIIINPLKFFLFYNISYLQKLNNTSAIGAGIQTPTIGGTTGFGFNAEFRYYPSAKAPRGFYFAPNISMNFLNEENGDEIMSPFSIGGLAGWQWFPVDDFAIGLGIGIDYYTNLRSGDVINDYDGTSPALRFDIGYAW